MKAAIIYASVHHENTKKVVEAIAGENAVDLIDATKEKERCFSDLHLWRQCGIPVNRRSRKKQAGEDCRKIFL